MKGKAAYRAALPLLVIALGASILLAVTIGSTKIPPQDVHKVVLYHLGLRGVGEPEGAVSDVVWLIRLPRLILAAGVGAALSVSGLVMQAVVRNPLADPYVLGVSSGSYLGAVLAILLGIGGAFGGNAAGVMAFIGAFAVSLSVAALASIGGRSSTVKLLLAGMAMSAVCSAFSNFIVYRTRDASSVQAVLHWMMGSLGAAQWRTNAAILFVVTLCTLFFYSQFRSLNLMLLGDEAAATLGTDARRRRIVYLLISALMVGFAVFSAGMIGFVGLVVPHAMRMLSGSDHRRLIPLCALSGAIFLVWADVLCRVVIPGAELPIGILTAMIGAPCFVYLMARRKYGFGGDA
ncbi:MAG: iron ABC transporter permease [Clostridiales bacterium]|jgi:iron complex transport system permease protein|nr:iron ABC transporter permease [Clostridiales bacterium]